VVIEACEAVKIPCSPCSREEHKKYIPNIYPPGVGVPRKMVGGHFAITKLGLSMGKSRPPGASYFNEKQVAR